MASCFSKYLLPEQMTCILRKARISGGMKKLMVSCLCPRKDVTSIEVEKVTFILEMKQIQKEQKRSTTWHN